MIVFMLAAGELGIPTSRGVVGVKSMTIGNMIQTVVGDDIWPWGVTFRVH
jgi:hypothetical protein